LPNGERIEEDVRLLVLPSLKAVSRFENQGYISTSMASDSALYRVRFYAVNVDSFDLDLLYVLTDRNEWSLRKWDRSR